MRSLIVGAALVLAAPLVAAPSRPDTVFFEDLTVEEIHDAIAAGSTNVIIATGGIADAGPSLVTATSRDIATYAADRIARAVGHTLVAPVISYGPGGLLPVPPDKGYEELLDAAVASVKGSGFKNIFLIGDSAGSQTVLATVAERLDAASKAQGVRVFDVSAYDVKARAEQDRYAAEALRFKPASEAQRISLVETSEVLAINAQRARVDAVNASDGVTPAPQHGAAFLRIKVDAAAAQIRTLLGSPPVAPVAPASVTTTTGPRVLPTPDPRRPLGPEPSPFLEDLTAAEIRDAVSAGRTVLIVPTGGTEKNGFHMATGKHNFHVRAGAALMAAKLGNALIAPVLQYVPEGQATVATPGVLSCARDCFEHVVTSIGRSAKVLGFKEILLIGDNGGNQRPLTAAAAVLNQEWDGSGVKAFALSDFYDKGHEYQDAWFLAQFGWDAAVVGSHAGIKDTSQMLYVKPEDVRVERIADSFNNKQESGISGDPTKATAEFGRVGLEFKANGAIAQYRALKAQGEGGSGRQGGRGGR